VKILVDYDGTLIKTKEEDFTKLYLSSLSKWSKIDLSFLSRTILKITKDLITNQNGEDTIYNQFMEKLVESSDKKREEWESIFTEYYEKEFINLKDHIIINTLLVEKLKKSKNEIIFASNPLFPEIAVKKRLEFANMRFKDFIFVATMENSRWLKPNPLFFTNIIKEIKSKPENCIMIGDTAFDKSCEKIGIKFIHVENEEEWLKII
jgi:FMN phosphatase YigB (HAD superfamily)